MCDQLRFVKKLRLLDKNKKKTLNEREFRRYITSMGETLSDEDVDIMLQALGIGRNQPIPISALNRLLSS